MTKSEKVFDIKIIFEVLNLQHRKGASKFYGPQKSIDLQCSAMMWSEASRQEITSQMAE